MRHIALTVLLCLLSGTVPAGEELPIFDAHLHYNGSGSEDAQAVFTPEEILAILDRNGIGRAVFSSRPNDGTQALFEAAPDRIIPFLMPYRAREDRYTYHSDPSLIPWLETWLEWEHWRGIGEFHLFSEHADSKVIRDMAQLAESRGLILQLHGEHGVVDSLFRHAPGVTIFWAHAGTVPAPLLVAQYLERHDRLYVDLSMRNERIAPEGKLDPQWADLFRRFPDRFMVGMDTFSLNRWRRFDELAAETRHWLRQLPPEIAEAIAWDNAERLFGS